MLEPFDNCGQFLCARDGSSNRNFRTGLESVRAPDETKIEKQTIGVFARARLRPGLLFCARAGELDGKACARTSGEIECSDVCRSTNVELAGDTTQEPLTNQCGHAATHRCNPLACENRPGSREFSTEQCRKFV